MSNRPAPLAVVTAAGLITSVAAACPPLAGGDEPAACTHPEHVLPMRGLPGGPVIGPVVAQHVLGHMSDADVARALSVLGDEADEITADDIEDPRYDDLAHAFSPALFSRLTETQIQMFVNIAETVERDGRINFHTCFGPGTDQELVLATEVLIRSGTNADHSDARFQQFNRWARTALEGSNLQSNEPTRITYSYVPDGTPVLSLDNNQGSNLFAWLNGIYGSPAVWQPLFDEAFQEWTDISGITYIYEPNDDGVSVASNLGGNLGFAGVRGDARIAAGTIDGNGNVLAFNFFPDNGDMVFDSADGFFNNTGNNSRGFRNVISHEAGHGLGMAHVCSGNRGFLMEPFIQTSFTGPQIDDELHAVALYGDTLEPNGFFDPRVRILTGGIGDSSSLSGVALSNTSDVDFYEVEVTEPTRLRVTVAPDGDVYLQGPQNGDGSCSAGSSTNYNTLQDLTITITDSLGVSTSIDATGFGGTEELAVDLITAGTALIQIESSAFTPVNFTPIQRYELDAQLELIPSPTIFFQVSADTLVPPGVPIDLSVMAQPNGDTITDGPFLFFRDDGGGFIQQSMTAEGGDMFSAVIPAPSCGDVIEYYFSVTGAVEGEISFPAAGPADPILMYVGTPDQNIFADDFSTDQGGYIVTGDATEGGWDRGQPQGNDRADPAVDATGSPTGFAYLTEIDPGDTNSDIDNGSTSLTTPSFDLSLGGVIQYAYWWNDDPSGPIAGADALTVDLSTDGGANFTQVRSYTEASDQWRNDSITIETADGSSDVVLRFTASDVGTQNVVEAGIDEIMITGATCEDVSPGCNPADIAEPFGQLDLSDIQTFLIGFGGGDPVADIAPPMGQLDLSDVQTFLIEFGAGCP